MGDIERIWQALLTEHLEARTVLCEIRLAGLKFEIDSPQTAPGRKAEAVVQRDAVLVEWGEVMTRLADARAGVDLGPPFPAIHGV